MMKWTRVTVVSLCVCAALCTPLRASAQGDAGYLYGRVILRNGDTLQGAIRWGDDELFWIDMFNSTKTRTVLDHFRSELQDHRRLVDDIYDQQNRDFNRPRITLFGRTFWDRNNFLNDHQFECHFGDIRRLEMMGGDWVRLTLKNDEQIELEGGSSDIGATIHVLDIELGEVKLRWSGIEAVEFMPTPTRLERTFGVPLYGVVKARLGEFEGLIQWDTDERLGSDVLDGEDEFMDLEIEFSQIASIERYGRGSRVTLRSGREYFLTGSNDVNSENRGIMVNSPVFGSLTVEWRDFDRVDFHENPPSGPAYDTFTPPAFLEATVRSWDDEVFTGLIFYDVDEAWDFEVLDGTDGDTEFSIPFRNIRSIRPERRYGSTVVLTNGLELHLDGSNDVTESNDGIVIWSGQDAPRYFLWRDVREIVFR